MWSKKFKDAVSSLTEQLPQLRDQLTEQFNKTVSPYLGNIAGGGGGGEEVQVGSYRLRVISKLGEGGYSFVYLVEEVSISQNNSSNALGNLVLQPEQQHFQQQPRRFALKKVLAGDQEQLAAAEREVDNIRKLGRHVNLLPLLDYQVATVDRSATGSIASNVVYMLFPLMDMNVWDFVQDRLKTNRPLSAHETVHLFQQLLAALHAMHSLHPSPLSHRDVKPHNIMLTSSSSSSKPSIDNTTTLSTNRYDGAHGGDGAQVLGLQSSSSGFPSTASMNNNSLGFLPHAVLMDFGSVAPAVVAVTSRIEALAVQEEAERHTTAPYRAPELWDVPSSCVIDSKVDIWAAGCVLYYLMVGETPFEKTANEAGGSLMLAIVNGQYSWPRHVTERYSAALREVVDVCLQSDPDARPTAAELMTRLQSL